MCAALPEQDAYVRHLQALQKVRDVCEGELNLPQICVVGDQSSGKSSLLTCITGIDFPVKSGICTKAPIVVECRSDTTVEKPIFELQDPGTKAYSEVNVDDLGGKVDKIQQAAVLKLLEGHDASKGEKPKISHEEIRVRVRGPEHIDIVVVDLPGMINAGDGKEASRELIRRYIKEEQTLILLVSEAKQDKELTSALDLAQEFDPRLIRTLRVLTKFDTFDSQDARTTALNLIRDQARLELGAHAVVCRSGGKEYNFEDENRVLKETQVPDQRAGVQTLRERLPTIFAELIRTNLKGLKASAECKLDTAQTQLESIGHEPLDSNTMISECQRVLTRKFFMLEQQLSPSMKQFQEAIHETEGEITFQWVTAKIEENVFKCPFFQGEDAFLCCVKDITEMWRPLVHKLVHEVEKHLAKSMQYVETDTIGVSKTLSECILAKWAPQCRSLIAAFTRECDLVLKKEADFGTMNHYLVDKYAEEMLMPDQFLDDFLKGLKWNDLHKPVMSSAPTLKQTEDGPVHSELIEGTSVSVTKSFITEWTSTSTVNKDKTEVKVNGESLPEGSSGLVIEINSDGDAHIQFSGVPNVTSTWVLKRDFDKLAAVMQKEVDWKDNLKSALKIATSDWMERKKRFTLHEHLQQRLFAAVKAAWTVEKKTFTDMVMKACRDSILQEHKQWVQTTLFNDKQIRDAAVEESSVASTRAQIKKTIAAMKESLQTLDTIMAKPI